MLFLKIVAGIAALIVGLELYTYRYRPDKAREDWKAIKKALGLGSGDD